MANCIFCGEDNPAGLSNCRLCSAPLPVSESAFLADDVFQRELLRLLRAGQRVTAIAAYRRRMGVELDAAVEAIDVLDRDSQFDVAPANADLEWAVIKYLERGEKIGAIKLYLDETRLGLKEAKDAVEAIELRMGLVPVTERRLGCLSMLLVLGLIATVAAIGH